MSRFPRRLLTFPSFPPGSSPPAGDIGRRLFSFPKDVPPRPESSRAALEPSSAPLEDSGRGGTEEGGYLLPSSAFSTCPNVLVLNTSFASSQPRRATSTP